MALSITRTKPPFFFQLKYYLQPPTGAVYSELSYTLNRSREFNSGKSVWSEAFTFLSTSLNTTDYL